MRKAHLLALLILVTRTAAAQTIEQLGFFRLQDDTPRSARMAALGGTADPSGTDFTINPATAASITKPTLTIQSQRQSNAITIYSVSDNTLYFDSAWMNRTQFTLLSGAMPVGPFVVGAYYARDPRLTGPESVARTNATAPYAAPDCGEVGCDFLLPMMNLVFGRDQRRYGITGAWQHGSLSIGAGLELQHLQETSEAVGTYVARSEPLPYLAQQQRLFRAIDERAIVPNVGVRWQATPRIALGAAYNGGGTFTRKTSACVVETFVWDDCTSAVQEIGSGNVRMPDAYRVSVGMQATDRVRLAAEAVRRNYSSLAHDEFSLNGEPHDFPYRDVTELHAGVEYRLASIALRAGWWTDPKRLDSALSVQAQRIQHYTAGAGIPLGKTLRLDLAYDRSEDPVTRNLVAALTF